MGIIKIVRFICTGLDPNPSPDICSGSTSTSRSVNPFEPFQGPHGLTLTLRASVDSVLSSEHFIHSGGILISSHRQRFVLTTACCNHNQFGYHVAPAQLAVSGG